MTSVTARGVVLGLRDRVRDAYRRIEEVDRPEIWISLRPEPEVLLEAEAVQARVRAGEDLPLAGLLVAVKGNIDVAGLPTTAGCPGYGYLPADHAPVVARIVAAGGLVLGVTNLDQFATGLVGTRSPYGRVRDARRPAYVSGGSSSGSAVAVALALVDVALGTDTAGSGRVPAAFGGIVGLKPTRGLLPTRGVVPACRELDCVSVFARDVGTARAVAAVAAGPDPADPASRPWPADAPLAAPPRPRVGVPGVADLGPLGSAGRAAFAAAVARLAVAGAELVPVSLAPFVAAGAMLYGGAFVAQRYAAVGAWLEAHRTDPDVDPTVAGIVLAAASVPAHRLVSETEALDRLRLEVRAVFAGVDGLLVPTVPHQPTIAEVAADPVGANARLGLWSTCANLLDLAAVAVPAGEADGGCFGVTVYAPAFADAVAADLAALLQTPDVGIEPPPGPRWGPDGVDLVVLGAHMTGLPLNEQLTRVGARLDREIRTAPCYRLVALGGEPPRPGLLRATDGDGASVFGELWQVPPAGLAALLAALPRPMALGPVDLDDGTTRPGFLCQLGADDPATDITRHGGWRAYLACLS
ncbi:MAG TPA: allophanate hydrolase [Kineosporiaceae bacterium]